MFATCPLLREHNNIGGLPYKFEQLYTAVKVRVKRVALGIEKEKDHSSWVFSSSIFSLLSAFYPLASACGSTFLSDSRMLYFWFSLHFLSRTR